MSDPESRNPPPGVEIPRLDQFEICFDLIYTIAESYRREDNFNDLLGNRMAAYSYDYGIFARQGEPQDRTTLPYVEINTDIERSDSVKDRVEDLIDNGQSFLLGLKVEDDDKPQKLIAFERGPRF